MLSLSVIVPVYGTSKYIHDCAASLFSQKVDDVEFIFVDDCSPDDSIEILERTVSEYDMSGNVRILRLEKNVGQAVAFKKALEICTGEYVTKCDSDDTVDPNMYYMMLSKAKAENLDMVVCDMSLVYQNGNVSRISGRVPEMDGISAVLRNRVPTSICNKLVRRSIFENDGFVFPEKSMCEDLVYSVQFEHFSESIGYVSQSLYNYYRHPQSYTWNRDRSAMISKFEQNCSNITLVKNFLVGAGLGECYKDEIIHMCYMSKMGISNALDEPGFYELWKNAFRELNVEILFCKTISIRERVIYLMTYLRIHGRYRRMKSKMTKLICMKG